MQEGAEEKANQPWRPENGMQLTSAYQHRAQHGFSGVLAGTPEQAKRYWDDPNSAKDPDEYWRRYYALEEESSSQSAEALSQNDAGTSRSMREGEGEKVNAHAKRLLDGAKDSEDYRDKHMTTEEIYHTSRYKNGYKNEITLKAHNRYKRLKRRFDVINDNKYLSEEDFDQIWEIYKENSKKAIKGSKRQLSDSDLSDFSA